MTNGHGPSIIDPCSSVNHHRPGGVRSMRNRGLTALLVSLVVFSASAGAQATAGLDPAALFEKGLNALEGSSTTHSSADAIQYFRRSAELGFAPAQVALGYLYETGHVTTSDPGQALEWYKKAAAQGDPLAQWLVGRTIIAGEVPPRDLNEAASWLKKSADQDDPFAKYLLGKIALERGDYARAAEQFRAAAQQGLPPAQRHIALLLRAGQGVPMDRFEAYVWMLASSDSGLHADPNDLQALEAELSGSQIEQAKSKARDVEQATSRSVSGHGCTGWRGEYDEIPAPPPPDLQRFCR